MIQIGREYKDYYYLLDDGNIYNAKIKRIIKPDKRNQYKLKTIHDKYKSISAKILFESIYNKPYCKDNIQNLKDEEWKEILDTNKHYYISNKGRVKSLQGYNAIILKPYSNREGYNRVDIVQNGKRNSKLVHKLTAAAWLPMPPQIDYQIHHKDFNKNNNAVDNLEYLSASEHAKKHAEHRKELDNDKE